MTVQDAAQPGQTQRILVQGDPSSGNGIMATFYLGRNASGSKPAADTAKQYKLDLTRFRGHFRSYSEDADPGSSPGRTRTEGGQVGNLAGTRPFDIEVAALALTLGIGVRHEVEWA